MNVSSVKNLNGNTFSAVQDLELTNFVQTNSGSWGGGADLPAYLNENSISMTGGSIENTDVIPGGNSEREGVIIQTNGITLKNDLTGDSTITGTDVVNWNEAFNTVYTNSGSWGGGGSTYTSPSGSIWISANNIESTDSAYIPSHQEDVLLTATQSYSSLNGYGTLANTNKVYFMAQGNRASAFDNEGTFLTASNNSMVSAETEYPPIKLYTNTWVSIKYSAYSAGIMDAYIVELAKKNEVNSALNNKLDTSAFTGYYPSNNPSGFAKASDAVMLSSLNSFDGRIVGINNQYFMGCNSAYNNTFVGTSAATGTKTASAYVGTGHQGVDIQISARNTGINYINWTAFSENGSDLSAGQLYLNLTTANKTSALYFISPLAENISGVKLYGNNQNYTAYSAYTIDVKQLAFNNDLTSVSDTVNANSASWGGNALSLSAGPGIALNIVNGVLVISATGA